MLEKERIEEEEAVADGWKEDDKQKDGAEIIVDVMASTVTEQCACSPEGGEDLSVDMGCSSAQLTSQSEPPLAEEKRSEERETIVTACFICKRRGHLAKDCLNAKTQILQAQSCEFCLKCGDKGHDMFTCKDGYSSTDLEKIQCGVCKAFGHLSCVDYKDYGPKQVSCYNCGMLCHLSSDCLNLRRNIQLASPSCKKGGTGPSCSEGNNSADHTLQDEKKGDKYLLCERQRICKGPGSSSANGESAFSTTSDTISNLYSTSDVNAYVGNFQE
ncbi:uncharacterized protein [Solanum lycopersicum]|uniref:uncharacterized protein isoform X6 n=1 Tax=Solanum lycopersicum TaxID=4081 RepID=UPI0002BCAED8|nr:uncharacterized protein C683.02c-like isoform X6 [Solanum lycopersicum]